MKRSIAILLLLAMILGVFAGCGKQGAEPTEAPTTATVPTEDNVPANAKENLAAAAEYLKTYYKDALTLTGRDFTRLGAVRVGLDEYPITWSTNVSEDVIKIVVNDDGTVTIDIADGIKEETPYVLTATLTDAYGNVQTVDFEYTIPASLGTMQEIVDLAYALENGAALDQEVTLTGEIISVNTPYDAGYKNVTVTIKVAEREDFPIMCYRLKGEGADTITVGDTITVTGIIKNYNGTIEFDAGCVLEEVVKGNVTFDIPSDPKEIVDMAYALGVGESIPVKVTLTGKVTEFKETYTDQYKNISVWMAIEGRETKPILAYRLVSGEGGDVKDVAVGDTITVTGTIVNYNGTIEFNAKCTMDARVSGGGKPPAEPQSNFWSTVPVVGETYYLFMDINGVNYYFTGKMDGKYLASSTNSGDAVEVTVERSNGYGYRFYFMDKGVKKYIEIYEYTRDDGKNRGAVRIVEEPTVTFYWSGKAHTYTVYGGITNDLYFLGTYGTFTTFSVSSIYYITGNNAPNAGVTQYIADLMKPEDAPAPEAPKDPSEATTLTIPEANELGKAQAAYTTEKYKVTGKITNVVKSDYGNLYIADEEGNEFYVYGTYSEDGSVRYDKMNPQPKVGDTITVYGVIGQYKGTPQMKNGWVLELIPGEGGSTEPEQPEQPEQPDVPATGAPVVGTAYKFGMVQGNVGKTYYLKGGMDGFYMATTEDMAEAIDVYLEETTGGYYFYTKTGDTKTYINMVVSGTHVNGAYEANASTVYTWDAESKTIIATVNDAPYWFGTRNDKNYTTMGPCATSFNGFYGQFYTQGGTTPEQPEQPEQPVTQGNKADFNTINSTGYSSYDKTFTTANGWVIKNSAIQVGGKSVANPAFPVIGADNSSKAVCMNGKTSAPGSITSPTLTGGISKLTMKYTKMFTDTKLSATITITDLATGNTYTNTAAIEWDKNTKYEIETFEWVLDTPVSGEFTIEVVNNCPTSQNANKDRMTVLELAWEGAHEHQYEATTTATCVADGITTYTCKCGDTYTEETAKLGHIDENLDVDCDRDGCTSKVAPPANSLLSNFTANNLGSKLSVSSEYYVQGTIVEVLDAKNGIFLIDDGTGETFYFRLPKNADGVAHASWAIKLTLGDKVKVYGKINKYTTNTAPNGQFWPAIQGGVVTLLEQHPHDYTFSPADCINPAACACGQTYGAPRGCVDADANNICDDCGKNTKYAYEYIATRTDNNSGVHDATAYTYTWTNGNFGVQVAKASGGNLYVTAKDHMRLYKGNQLVLVNKNGLTVKTITVYLTNATQIGNFEKFLTGYTYTKNEVDFTITVEVDSFETLTLTNPSSNGSTTQVKGVEFGYDKKGTVDKAAAEEVIALIDAIGEVTLEKEEAIVAARVAYEALTDDQKSLVTNLETLTAAEAALEELKKPAEPEVPTDPVEILKAAYALADGEALPYTATLTGKIITVDEAYSTQFQNVTVTMVVTGAESMPIKCYRMKGTEADTLNVNDIITVTGTIKNYKGTIEFDTGCTLDAVTQMDPPAAPVGAATISFADKANRTTYTTSLQVWEQNGIKVTNEKAKSSSNVGDYFNPGRFYKNSSLKIEFAGMKKIVITSDGTAKYLNALKDSLTAAGIAFTASNNVITIELAEAADVFEIADLSGGQCRIKEISIYTA